MAASGSVAAHPAAAAESSPALSFIEALAAIPDATRTLNSARAVLAEASTRRATVRASAIAADAALSRANDAAREARLVSTYADRAAARAHDAIDDAAREMYSTGGTVPTLTEVLMTADSESGLTRSLQTRQYLASVGTDVVGVSRRADVARQQADAVLDDLHADRDRVAVEARVAVSALATADRALDDARADVDTATRDYRALMRITRADRSADYGRIKQCGDWLARLLSRSGFEGENLREAWAIVMRESGGRADAVSVTNDLGLFQINTATWRKQPWFDREMLLTKRYNATVAHTLSRGGRTWYSWGLDGHGRPDARAYVKAGWSDDRIIGSIVMPYVQWYAQYPCRPAYERDLGLGIPARPLADEGRDPALQRGDGVRPSDDGPAPVDGAAPTDDPGGPAAP